MCGRVLVLLCLLAVAQSYATSPSATVFQADVSRTQGALESLNGRALAFLQRFEGKLITGEDARREMADLGDSYATLFLHYATQISTVMDAIKPPSDDGVLSTEQKDLCPIAVRAITKIIDSIPFTQLVVDQLSRLNPSLGVVEYVATHLLGDYLCRHAVNVQDLITRVDRAHARYFHAQPKDVQDAWQDLRSHLLTLLITSPRQISGSDDGKITVDGLVESDEQESMKLYAAAAMEESFEKPADLTPEEKTLEIRVKILREAVDSALGPLPPSAEQVQAMKTAADIEKLNANNELKNKDGENSKDEL